MAGNLIQPPNHKFSTNISTAVENTKTYTNSNNPTYLAVSENQNVRISFKPFFSTTGRKGNTRGYTHSTKKNDI
jgi:hypothetical protein